MGKRTEAAALRVECSTCGAKVAEPCKNYAGVNCAPHAVRERMARPVSPRALLLAPVPAKMVQRELFRLDNDAQREGGL